MFRSPFPIITGFGSVHGVPGLPPGFIDVFESYRVPTGEVELDAVIGGEGPPLLRVADDVRCAVLPGCGHFVPEETPEALLALLTPFLEPYRAEAG